MLFGYKDFSKVYIKKAFWDISLIYVIFNFLSKKKLYQDIKGSIINIDT